MKFNFRFFAPLIGAMLLGTVAFAAYNRVDPPVVAAPYQASVIGALVPAETQSVAVEESVPQAEPAEPAVVPQPAAVAPVVTIPTPVVPLPAQTPVVQVAPVPVFVPVLTTSVGFGGTLANRVPEQLPTPVVVASEPIIVATSTAEINDPVSEPVIEQVASTTPTIAFVCTADFGDAESATGHVVINELFIDMEGGDTKEFVELYNPTDVAVNLASSSLQYLSGSAVGITSVTKKDFPASATIAAHGFYLIGMGGYTGEPAADMAWSQSLSNTGATVLLVRNRTAVAGATDEDITDRIAYGSGAILLGEDLPAPLPPIDQSIGRTAGSFTVQATPSPRAINLIIAL